MKSFLIVVGFIAIIIVVRMVVSRVLGLAFNPLEAKLRQKILGTSPATTDRPAPTTAPGTANRTATANPTATTDRTTTANPTATTDRTATANPTATTDRTATANPTATTDRTATANPTATMVTRTSGEDWTAPSTAPAPRPAGSPIANPPVSGLESFQVVNRAVTTLAAHLPEAAATEAGAAHALFAAVAEALRAEDEASLLDGFVQDPKDDSQVKRALRQHLRDHPEAAAELSRLTSAAA
jgi:hypothetical protein